MSVKNITRLALAASFVGGFGLASIRAADDSALLDLLVHKRLITEKEASEVRADLKKEAATSSSSSAAPGSAVSDAAAKLKLSAPITEFEIYGDARLRFEVRNGETGNPNGIDPAHDTYQRDRERYRLRLGIRGILADDWFFGLRLETSTNPRSTNVTFGGDTSTGPGPFAKNDDTVNVGQAYLGYSGLKDFRFTGGKMPNPFVTSSMVWDGDINPEGLAEQYKHTFQLTSGNSSEPVTTTDKDGKTVTSPVAPSNGMSIDVFANFAQFVYDDTNPDNPIGPAPGIPNTDSFMLGWQIGAKLNFNKNIYVQLAPTLYNYTGNGDTFNKVFSGDPDFLDASGARVTRNQTGINSLLVFELPGEFGWTWGGIPFRIFGDFAANLDADDRAEAAGHPDKGDQRYAYQVGLGVGKIKTKHDWALSAFYQHAEQYSLDPNLVDSDIFDSRVNMEGPAITFGYALSDAVIANITYAYGQQIDHDLGTGGVGDIGLNPLRRYQVFQADLSVKF